MSSSREIFLSSLRALFSSAFAVLLSVFSLPFPGFFVFFPILSLCLSFSSPFHRLDWRHRSRMSTTGPEAGGEVLLPRNDVVPFSSSVVLLREISLSSLWFWESSLFDPRFLFCPDYNPHGVLRRSFINFSTRHSSSSQYLLDPTYSPLLHPFFLR